MKKHLSKIIFALIVLVYIVICFITTPITGAIGSMWSLLPPIVAIGLALITKEVYSSLFAGIITGGIIYAISSGTGFEGFFGAVVKEGIITNLADSYNAGILMFLVVLGIIVVLMNKAGGSNAYGEWAAKHIKSRKGACISTFLLGCLIFVDDYFNCLTVGSVMRPVTDKHSVSRAKLAYLIDATAAPVCIIAPISSWAAAVSGTVEGVNGIQLSAAGGLGLEFLIGKHFGLYLDPSARYYFDCGQPSSIRTKHPFMLNYEVGVRFNL